MEVEKSILCTNTVTDIYITSFQIKYLQINHHKNIKLWLITSPEYYIKRLLSAESGPIYQIYRSFRNKELGQYHNPELTMLE